MKLFAHYDAASGKIRSVTWHNAPDGVSLMLTPSPGELVTEIQGHDFGNKMPGEDTLRDLITGCTIAEPIPRSTLKKKSSEK